MTTGPHTLTLLAATGILHSIEVEDLHDKQLRDAVGALAQAALLALDEEPPDRPRSCPPASPPGGRTPETAGPPDS